MRALRKAHAGSQSSTCSSRIGMSNAGLPFLRPCWHSGRRNRRAPSQPRRVSLMSDHACTGWRPHPYFKGVDASSAGVVRQVVGISEHYPKPRVHKTGYLVVNLLSPINLQSVKVHRIVAECWHGRRPDGCDTAHKDGNKLNNDATNLMFCTRKANSLHKLFHGSQGVCPAIRSASRRSRAIRTQRLCSVCGQPVSSDRVFCSRLCMGRCKRSKGKLNQLKVEQIRQHAKRGQSARAIAKEFGVSSHTVSRILRGLLWATEVGKNCGSLPGGCRS